MRFASGSWKKLLFVVISGVSLLPASAVAENARGKFTLARDVRWGAAKLPAGDYSYTFEHHAAETVTVHSLNGGPSAIVLASSVSIVDPATAPRLMLKQEGSDWVVTSMVVGGDGEELHFATKAPSYQEAKRPAKVAVLSSTSKP